MQAFRERVDADAFVWGSKEKDGDRGYEQGFYDHLEHLYGVQSGETIAIQNLGRVLTDEGRLVVFPNVLQHRVEPFRLRDPSKPGTYTRHLLSDLQTPMTPSHRRPSAPYAFYRYEIC